MSHSSRWNVVIARSSQTSIWPWRTTAINQRQAWNKAVADTALADKLPMSLVVELHLYSAKMHSEVMLRFAESLSQLKVKKLPVTAELAENLL